MTPRIYIAMLVILVATVTFWAVSRAKFSMQPKHNVFGSYTKAALFNAMFFVTTCWATWEIFTAIAYYELYLPRRGYWTIVIRPETHPLQFILYTTIFSLLFGSGIAFLSKSVIAQKKSN